jgi:hypothetical protein
MNGENDAFAASVETVAVLWEYCSKERQQGEEHGQSPQEKFVEDDQQTLGSAHTNAASC